MNLEEVRKRITRCRKCRLWKTRKNAVPGEGNPRAKIMFIGQAPGRTEDATGKPFVGRAGKLLTETLVENGLERKDVFITSVLRCFPPRNRMPRKDEIDACKPYLLQYMKLIKPKTVFLLGNVAVKTVLGDVGKLDRIHGKRIVRDGIEYIPTYHPAAGIRFPEIKKKLKMDFKKQLYQ